MRTWLVAALLSLLLAVGMSAVWAAEESAEEEEDATDVQVVVNGKPTEVVAFTVDGLTFVHIEPLAELLGLTLKLDEAEGKLYLEAKAPPAAAADPATVAVIELVKKAKSFAGVAGLRPLANDTHLSEKEMKFRNEPVKVLGWAAEAKGGDLYLVSYQYVPTAGRAITVWTASEPELTAGKAKDAPRGWFWEVQATKRTFTYVNGNPSLEKKYGLTRAH